MARVDDPVSLLQQRQQAVRVAEDGVRTAQQALADACARANGAGMSFSQIGDVLDVSKQYAQKLAASSELYVSQRDDDAQLDAEQEAVAEAVG